PAPTCTLFPYTTLFRSQLSRWSAKGQLWFTVAKAPDCITLKPKMKQFITNVLTEFQKGRLTLAEAADRLLAENKQNQSQKAKSKDRKSTRLNSSHLGIS